MGEARRGHLRIFLGMAAGVGKTFRMLVEGHSEQEAGRDVVIGLMESHGRAETAELAEGLLWIPQRRVLYRGTTLEEMDLPAILIRAPELCLVDELAHSNAPGVEHAKRYEDVEEMLTAGIDVLSTLNVQHLESLNDLIAELSGVRVRETIPDAVLGRADEIVLVDLPPEALLDRLRAGKIYRPERIDAALNNFFKLENLAALREIALRQVAQEVGHKRLTTIDPVSSRDDSIAAGAPQAVSVAASSSRCDGDPHPSLHSVRLTHATSAETAAHNSLRHRRRLVRVGSARSRASPGDHECRLSLLVITPARDVDVVVAAKRGQRVALAPWDPADQTSRLRRRRVVCRP